MPSLGDITVADSLNFRPASMKRPGLPRRLDLPRDHESGKRRTYDNEADRDFGYTVCRPALCNR